MYVRGLLSDQARKNGWTLAAYAGASDATSMQRMLNAARWDTDGVRDDVRRWVAQGFGDWRRGILVVDEVRFPKVGSHSVGVHRQYAPGSLRAGNAQVAVFLSYVSPRGSALVDRELYLPEDWLTDRVRARRLGVPDAVAFADRDELAIRMIERAFNAHGPAASVVAGGSLATSRLQTWLQERTQPYVLPIAAGTFITLRDGTRVEAGRVGEAVPPSAWVRVDPRSATPGADERWALVALPDGAASGAGDHPRWERGLLLRRSSAPGVRSTAFQCRFSSRMRLIELVRAARAENAVQDGVRWANEHVGLDHYQVRRYDAWYRHMTLGLLAAAYVAVSRPHS
jgi:SRSO17 transposase